MWDSVVFNDTFIVYCMVVGHNISKLTIKKKSRPPQKKNHKNKIVNSGRINLLCHHKNRMIDSGIAKANKKKSHLILHMPFFFLKCLYF